MNVTQSLSDIQVMLKYIEGLITERSEDRQTEQLSTIGKHTLEIINSIKTANATLLRINDGVMVKHEGVLKDNSLLAKESLEGLIQRIEANEATQTTIHQDIQDIFTKYDESVLKIIEQMTENKTNQEAIVSGLNEKLTNINQSINNIDEKVLTKNDMASLIDKMNEQLGVAIRADAEMNEANQEMLNRLHNDLSETKAILKSSSDDLQSIKENYTESTSRLSVLDTKMDAMMKHIMKGE